MFSYCENNPVMHSDPTGEFWNVAVGGLIGGLVCLASSAVTAKIAGDRLTASDMILSFVTGAVSGALAASGLPVKAITAVNTAVSSGASIIEDIANGDAIDFGKAVIAGGVSAISSMLGGNGIRYKGGQYSTAKNAAVAAKNTAKNAAKGPGRKAANKAANKAMRHFKDTYLNLSYKQLGMSLGSGAVSIGIFSIYGGHKR